MEVGERIAEGALIEFEMVKSPSQYKTPGLFLFLNKIIYADYKMIITPNTPLQCTDSYFVYVLKIGYG